MLQRSLLLLPMFASLLCAADRPLLEVTSPLGTKFYSKPDEKGVVAAAEKALAADPKNVKLLLKLSQAQNSLQQIKQAVNTLSLIHI